jgi:hypothetical protein
MSPKKEIKKRFNILLKSDHSPDTLLGEYLQEYGVFNPAVYDVG